MDYQELYQRYELVLEENKKLKAIIQQLRNPSVQQPIGKEGDSTHHANDVQVNQRDYTINPKMTSKEKIRLFSSLFRGRPDVCAKKWKNKSGYSPFCLNDFKPGICNKPKVKCTSCNHSAFVPLNDDQIKNHLLGNHVLGLYPLTTNDTCYLLAIDFDEASWREDANIVKKICHGHNVPVYVERSRSGEGCHLWFFFEKETKASKARRFGTTLLSLAMQESNSIGFASFDRLFPSQDFLQKDGFGNLIALPLQREARNSGKTVFVDEEWVEINDQWQYLSQIKRIPEDMISSICKTSNQSKERNEVDSTSIMMPSYHLNRLDFPENLIIKKNRGIEISKIGLSSKALLSIRQLSSYANPEFYAKQAMRQSTYGTPRVTVMFEEDANTLVVPRGVEKELLNIIEEAGGTYSILEERQTGRTLDIQFNGQLTIDQELAFHSLHPHDEGVLSATTGFGKTVIGARLIAEKQCPALILVHTKELAMQWKERLEQFLIINEVVEKEKGKRKTSTIGLLGGGKNSIHEIVDIAIMQSMFDKDKNIKSFIQHYGLILVDECHHVSAANFSRILQASNAKYVYGLTATPIRKDGHHPIIFMHCGPIRHKIDPKQEAKKRDFDHFIVPRFVNTRMPSYKKPEEWRITEIYQHICESDIRNEKIAMDIISAVRQGRNPLVLTERVSQIERLAAMLVGNDFDVIVLSGSQKTRDRKESVQKLRMLSHDDRFVLLATGKLIGEGFDEARLDTLFLAMPIAWKGRIAQYAGRLHRSYQGKKEVLIYDYVDVHIPVLERMYHKRLTAYRSVGYSIRTDEIDRDSFNGIYDDTNYFETLIQDINRARKSVIISSPFLMKKNVDTVKEMMFRNFARGIRIAIYTRIVEEHPEKYREGLKKVIAELTKEGVSLFQLANHHHKFTIIDEKILWYGGIDFLGGHVGEESLIRLEDEELANEFMGILSNDRKLESP
jgi:superfamily II DNA or RNA helicase